MLYPFSLLWYFGPGRVLWDSNWYFFFESFVSNWTLGGVCIYILGSVVNRELFFSSLFLSVDQRTIPCWFGLDKGIKARNWFLSGLPITHISYLLPPPFHFSLVVSCSEPCICIFFLFLGERVWWRASSEHGGFLEFIFEVLLPLKLWSRQVFLQSGVNPP